MSGYSWGIERKKILIAYESAYKPSSTDFKIATREDIPDICQFLHATFPKSAHNQAKIVSEMIQNTDTHALFLAIHEAKMVGVLPVLYNTSVVSGEKVAMFEAVIVDEADSNHAIEKELLEYAIASCTKIGCKRVILLSENPCIVYEE